jgi:hypothetical protein
LEIIMIDSKSVDAKQSVPLDFVDFLCEITCDNTWHASGELTFVNANESQSALRIDGRTVLLSINGRPVYEGPLF